jgi:hypothetical protein
VPRLTVRGSIPHIPPFIFLRWCLSIGTLALSFASAVHHTKSYHYILRKIRITIDITSLNTYDPTSMQLNTATDS